MKTGPSVNGGPLLLPSMEGFCCRNKKHKIPTVDGRVRSTVHGRILAQVQSLFRTNFKCFNPFCIIQLKAKSIVKVGFSLKTIN